MRYTLPGIPTLLAALAWFGEQWISQTFNQSFSAFPWGWILLILGAFLAGQIYGDLWNQHSVLRERLRHACKVANVENFVLAHRTNEAECWYEAVIHCRFLKKKKHVQCTIEVTQYAGINHAERCFVIHTEEIAPVEPNLRKEFVVAKFPKRKSEGGAISNPYWDCDSAKTWAGDGNHVVTLKIKAGRMPEQVEKLLISTIKDVGGGPEPVLLFGGPQSAPYVQIA